MNDAITNIFTKASTNAVEQGRFVLKLKKIYEKSNPNRFREVFLKCCLKLTKYDYKKSNNQVERCLRFAAVFCGNCYNADEVDEVDQFVVDILDNMLQNHNSSQTNFRYYISKIIRLIIDEISVHLRDDVCDRIQEAMFRRLTDNSAAVREQAVLALMRLQRPDISNCPVIEKYIERITSDPNSTVRKVLVQKIAMTRRSLPVIYESIASVDAAVRNAAYLRCSLQEPHFFEIKQRQSLVISMAFDDHEPNRAILERRLWPRWLDSCCQAADKAASKAASESSINVPSSETNNPDSCLLLLHMLRLDEDIDQLHQTYLTYKVVLTVHFNITQAADLVQALRLDMNKLIPMEYLTLESAFYWKYLFKYVLKDENLGEYADEIVAELAGFCEYIGKYIKKTFIDTPYKKFTWLPNQHTLLQLLEMVSYSDLNDDFGRERLSLLLSDILQNVKNIHEDVLNIIVRLYCKIEKDFKKVCEHICEILTNIMRPYKVTPLHDTIRQERDFMLAKLKFTLSMAEDSHGAAIEANDYIQASEFHKQIMSLRDQIAAVPNDAQLLEEHQKQQKMNGRQDREGRSKDPEKHLQCCNILYVIMELCFRRGYEIPPILYTAKTELVDGLLNNEYDYDNNQLYAKALEIVTYYGLMDKDIAEIAIITIISPIISYRLIHQYNLPILLATLTGFTYFVVKYGVEILQHNESRCDENAPQANRVNSSSQLRSFSRIEQNTSIEDVRRNIENMFVEDVSMEEFQAIILEMLDDENLTLSLHAAICITNLLKYNIGVNVASISNLLLKWFTPESYDRNPKMLYILSTGISRLGETTINNIGTIMEESALCIIRNIIDAPVDSSLYSCNLPKCLQFLASMTLMAEPNQSEIHRKLAQEIIPLLNSDNIDNRSKEVYSKFLSYMDAPLFDMDSVRRFSESLENIDFGGHKIMRANIAKYLSKLRNNYNGSTIDTLAASTQATISLTSSNSHVIGSDVPPLIIARPTDMQLSRIQEIDSNPRPGTSSGINRFGSSVPISSTPMSKSVNRSSLVPQNEEIEEISYHISESDTDSGSNNVVVPQVCIQAKDVNDALNETDSDIVISPADSEGNLVIHVEHNKENSLNDKRLLRQRTQPSKRLFNYSSQDGTSSSSNCDHPQKKRKLSSSLNIPNGITNNNWTNKQNGGCNDLEDLQIESGSSSQCSTDSSSSRKRGRPSRLSRQNSILQINNISTRTSERISSRSINNQNCRVNIQLRADVHHVLTPDSDTSSSMSHSPCKLPRKKSRPLPRSSTVNRNQINGQMMMRNEIKSKLQSIENNFDAIDIAATSSSSEQEETLRNRGKRLLKIKKDHNFHY